MGDAKPELQLPSEFSTRIWDVATRLDEAVAYDTPIAVELAEQELRLLAEAEQAVGRRLQ